MGLPFANKKTNGGKSVPRRSARLTRSPTTGNAVTHGAMLPAGNAAAQATHGAMLPAGNAAAQATHGAMLPAAGNAATQATHGAMLPVGNAAARATFVRNVTHQAGGISLGSTDSSSVSRARTRVLRSQESASVGRRVRRSPIKRTSAFWAKSFSLGDNVKSPRKRKISSGCRLSSIDQRKVQFQWASLECWSKVFFP